MAQVQTTPAPTAEQARIESLDVLRGFALLGILLLNIIGFGLVSSAYQNPLAGFTVSADIAVWAGIELFAEGAMRTLFSMLFGAGVVLFVGDLGKGISLHMRRNFWLLVLGLIDGYVLLWNGDILINYALAGALLYTVRNVSAQRLAITAAVLIVLMSLMYAATKFGLDQARLADAPEWHDFVSDFVLTEAQAEAEVAARQASYAQAFNWNMGKMNEMLFFVLPFILFWDALAMMLLGMALYKSGVLQGDRSNGYYVKLAVYGFTVGLLVNGYEVYQAWHNDFEILSVFPQAQVTYHFGRLGIALGYLGVLMLLVKHNVWSHLRKRLAAVGRMALTNYLMHSFICLFIFTGAGLGWVDELMRWQLYVVVILIWSWQLWFSPWWLARFHFGPVEWLWRSLTYGHLPKFSRNS